MIVRDEALVLEECLRSIRRLVDQIVIVDTGSTDASRVIAERFDAEVVAVPWRGDFAAARNEALALARGGWILYIDADERVCPAERSLLDPFLADISAVAYTVRFRPKSGYTCYREYRIFRNDPRIRFHGVIHETVLPGLFEVARRDGLRIGQSELAIEHVGYDGDQHWKHVRNLPLLRERVREDPEHVYSWQHLGATLAALGDLEAAEAAWRRGIEVVRRKADVGAADSLAYIALLRHQLESGVENPALLEEALKRFPDNFLLAWIHGRALMKKGRYADALPLFEGLAAIDPASYCDDRIAYDGRIFGTWAYDSLALCHFRLGRLADSAKYYALAEAATPGNPEYPVKRRLAEARARQASER